MKNEVPTRPMPKDFRLRAGERLIDPATQEHIRQVMTRIGIAPLPDFDDYVEEYAW